MAQPLLDLMDQFCIYQRKQKGKTEGGARTYRWNLEQLTTFVRNKEGRVARVGDLNPETLQAWMDQMASEDLALSTMRSRQSTVSSFCNWLVKRGILQANPVVRLDRPPHRKESPRQVPGPELRPAHPGRTRASASARRGALSYRPLHRHAARIGHHLARPESCP